MKSSAVLALISAIFPALLAMPGNAESTRTWVSGVGDTPIPAAAPTVQLRGNDG